MIFVWVPGMCSTTSAPATGASLQLGEQSVGDFRGSFRHGHGVAQGQLLDPRQVRAVLEVGQRHQLTVRQPRFSAHGRADVDSPLPATCSLFLNLSWNHMYIYNASAWICSIFALTA